MVGLGFGAEFIPIYQRHPEAEVVAVCRRNEAEMNKLADAFKIGKRYTNYEQVLADPDIDFVHINSPIPDHAWMSMEALRAGKHVMCTVPMATTVADCEKICQLVADTGLKYMMAETVVYSREFLFIKQMYEKGEFGKIQYLQASHPQDMDGWPDYWERMIPMHYATHVVSPVLGLMNSRPSTCRASARARCATTFARSRATRLPSSRATSRSPTATWRPTSGDSCTTRPGSTAKASTCTARRSRSSGRSSKARRTSCTRPSGRSRRLPSAVEVPDFAHLLPEEIRPFTRSIVDADHLSFLQGGGHGGSHPHLVNEFVSALVDDRDPWPNAPTSANWTCVGILAHESALAGGEIRQLPEFTRKR